MKHILYFSATWCGPCKALAPIMESLKGQVTYKKVDIDQEFDLAAKHSVRSVPTLVLIDETGEVQGRLVGTQSSQNILDFYNNYNG